MGAEERRDWEVVSEAGSKGFRPQEVQIQHVQVLSHLKNLHIWNILGFQTSECLHMFSAPLWKTTRSLTHAVWRLKTLSQRIRFQTDGDTSLPPGLNLNPPG
jgi:hypothetical protein